MATALLLSKRGALQGWGWRMSRSIGAKLGEGAPCVPVKLSGEGSARMACLHALISFCYRGHSWLAAFAALDPSLAERLACALAHLLERHRSNLYRDARGKNTTAFASMLRDSYRTTLQCALLRGTKVGGPSPRDSREGYGEVRKDEEYYI